MEAPRYDAIGAIEPREGSVSGGRYAFATRRAPLYVVRARVDRDELRRELNRMVGANAVTEDGSGFAVAARPGELPETVDRLSRLGPIERRVIDIAPANVQDAPRIRVLPREEDDVGTD